ncbi:MAG: peptidylprolyl isomerase [Sphingobacteriales bacterium]|nr:peptidylprolyl isomerase [Sphingobacteriales bacterium]
MKKIILLSANLLMGISLFAQQPLMNYGKHSIGKVEFLKAYNKNKPATDNTREKSVKEYVDLYANFKMKVMEALELRLDTAEQFKSDVDNFRKQIIENYLSDEKTFNALTDEAYTRSLSDLHVVRYSVTIDENTSPEDSMAKYNAIKAISEQLKKMPNSRVNNSESPLVDYSDMGFLTVFSLPYVYENIVYGLKPGETSSPYRAKKAWHVFSVIEKRKSVGKWKIAQILFSTPENADESIMQVLKAKADSVYTILSHGADFSNVAKFVSDDKLTYLNGGELPEFGTGKYDNVFESEAIRLYKDGDISEPFQTSFGIHILKRLSQTPAPSTKTDDNWLYDIKQKLQQDDRIKIAKDKFAKDIITKIGFKLTNAVKAEDLYNFADSVMFDFEIPDAPATKPISKKVLINFTKGNATGEDWLNFVRDYKGNPDLYKMETNAMLWEKFKTYASLNYYKNNLEFYNADFAYQMQEFKEGNLLFEIMEKNVWSKASSDSVGLRAYYNAHKNQYIWSKSADVLIMNAVSDDIAKAAKESIQSGVNWKELVEVNQGELQGDSGRFELTQINADSTATEDSYSPVTINSDGTAGFMKYLKFYNDGEQRSFEDARGMVINDYQGVVEKKWITELQKKYPVKINQQLLNEIIQKQ